jgi:sigma-B regulation protein RsbU (phosphoserine phosphatase)
MSSWWLEIESVQSPRAMREVDRDQLVLGRGTECDVQLADPRVSRQHCRIDRRAAELWVEDLGSRRGTRLNGEALEAPAMLSEGDLLELSEQSRVLIRTRLDRRPEKETRDASATVFRDAAAMLVHRRDLESASSAEEMRRIAERMHLLNEVHQALAASPSRDALLEMILDRVFHSLRPEQAAIMLLDGSGNLVQAVTRPAQLTADQLFFSRSLVREVTTRRVAALVLDAPTDERFAGAVSMLDAGVRSVLAAPLLLPDGVLGLIVLSSRLRVRHFGEDDLGLLVSLASVAALHLRNLALADEAAERRLMQQELDLARRIQLALLPSALPAVPGYELVAGNLPSRGVSGDLYAVGIHPERGLMTCLVADVSGKGIAASLLGASLEALAAGPIEVGYPPDEICGRVARRLFQRTPPEKYATGFVAQIDPATHRLLWCNAGHNPALIVRRGGGVELLSASGPPLGLLAHATYKCQATDLAPGDLLLIYTDGITEAVNPEDEEFGLERLTTATEQGAADPLADLRSAIELELQDFVRGVPYADDRTLVLLRRVATASV